MLHASILLLTRSIMQNFLDTISWSVMLHTMKINQKKQQSSIKVVLE